MSVDMTESYIAIDMKLDDWQTQVIEAFKFSDLLGGDAVNAQDASLADWSKPEANANGCVQTGAGYNVKVDGSAFLYVNEQFSTKVTNQASGLSSAAGLDKQVQAKIGQRLGG